MLFCFKMAFRYIWSVAFVIWMLMNGVIPDIGNVSGHPMETEHIIHNSSISHSSSDSEKWNLILVNPWNPVPENYKVNLIRLKNGQAVDSRCYPQLQQMMNDCRADGLNPKICASYRTMEKQQSLFRDKMRRVIADGCPPEQAEEEAAKTIARPGTSEHQLGLALDIVDRDYQMLNTRQETTPVQQWLMKNSWKYGFILRYPTNKSEITGIIYEPWHYRYVGKEAAEEIHEKGICLEEYLRIHSDKT